MVQSRRHAAEQVGVRESGKSKNRTHGLMISEGSSGGYIQKKALAMTFSIPAAYGWGEAARSLTSASTLFAASAPIRMALCMFG